MWCSGSQKRRHRMLLRCLTILLILILMPARKAYALGGTVIANPGAWPVTCNDPANDYVITGTGNGMAASISGGDSANPIIVTLENLTVQNSGGGHSNAPVQVESGSYCIIKLSGTNTLVGGWHEITLKADEGIAGLRVMPGATCIITSASGDDSTEGTLNASCSHDDHGGAGIGSSYNEDTGTIIIRGGTIAAQGGHCGAGIGSGRDGICTDVRIEGGRVTATGGEYAAGIGGGDSVGTGSGGNTQSITISGGEVYAYGGNNGGAGIGGSEGGEVNSIRITGGNIVAKGCGESPSEGKAAGIGGGDGKAASSIVIDQAEGVDLTIEATGHHGAGIGSAGATAGTIDMTLRGGSIRAIGGDESAGIGGGCKQSGPIYLKGRGEIRAKAGGGASAIGAGRQKHSKEITIQGSGENLSPYNYPLHILAEATTSTEYSHEAALIGSGDGTAGNIAINNAFVELNPYSGTSSTGAGIGTGCSNDLSLHDGGIDSIVIRNSQIKFSGGGRNVYGAGIGAGFGSHISTIELTNVTYDGPTIGTSCSNRALTDENSVESIYIAGSNITAKPDDLGSAWAGIGTGPYGSIGSITILNSDVEAEGVSGGSGIGTGGLILSSVAIRAAISGQGKCGDITIRNTDGRQHHVTATGCHGGAGIGGGVLTSVEGTISIESANVVARADKYASDGGGAGIGGGGGCSVGAVRITNSNVTATGGNAAAGIGSSGLPNDTWVDGIVEATWNTVCGDITIESNSTVTATAGDQAAGIGLGRGAQQKSGAWFRISDSTVDATGGENGAGIGGGGEGGLGRGAEAHRISISGSSKVTAHGGAGAAGIGAGYQGDFDTCRIDLTNYYNDSVLSLNDEAHAYVMAYGGIGAAGIGAGASSHDSGNKGTLDGDHDAVDIRISGGFVYAQGGGYSYSVAQGQSGPGAGIGGGSHQGDLENCIISGGVVIAHAGSKSDMSGAVAAEDIGHGGSRQGGNMNGEDESCDIHIKDGTVLARVNQNEAVKVSGGSVSHQLALDKACGSDGRAVYQTSFVIDTEYLPSTSFADQTFYKLDDLMTSVSNYGGNHVFAQKCSDTRAQIWLYLPQSAADAATADFHIKTNTQHAAGTRRYYGTTEQGYPDFNATPSHNVLKMGSPLALEPDPSTAVPYADQEFKLNVVDTNLGHTGKSVTFGTDAHTSIVADKTQPELGDQPSYAYVTVKPTTAGETMTVTASVEDTPASDLYWGTEARYSALVGVMPLSIKITSDPSRTYNGEPIDPPAVKVTGTDDEPTFTYRDATDPAAPVDLGTQRPVEPGTYVVTATVTRDAQSVSDSKTFTIDKYHAQLSIQTVDYVYTGEAVDDPACTVGARETQTPAKDFFEDAHGTVSFAYSKRVGSTWEPVECAIGVGTYRVRATAKGNDYYYASSTVPGFFSILEPPSKTDPYLFVDMLDSHVYDLHCVEDPVVWTNSDGNVSITYYDGDTALDGAPIDAGSYTMVVQTDETERFNAASQTRAFTIEPRPAYLMIDAVSNSTGSAIREGATVYVRMENGLADVEDQLVDLEVVSSDESGTSTGPTAYDAQFVDADGSYTATYSFPSVTANTYTLKASIPTSSPLWRNYTIEPAERAFAVQDAHNWVDAHNAKATFGDDGFSLQSDVTDDAGDTVTDPPLTYRVVTSEDYPRLAQDVVTVQEQEGMLTIMNAGIAAVRVDVQDVELENGGTILGTHDFAIVEIDPAPLPLSFDVADKTFDGDPAEVVCTVNDQAFPAQYTGKDDIEIRYYYVAGDAVAAQYLQAYSDAEAFVDESSIPEADMQVQEAGELLIALDEAPVAPGSYVAVACASGDRNFTGTILRDAYTISQPVPPDDPDTPDTPDEPDTPDTPDTPDEPVDPTKPDTPSTPDTPKEPDNPDQPTEPSPSNGSGTTTPADSGTVTSTPTTTTSSASQQRQALADTADVTGHQASILGGLGIALLALAYLLCRE